MTASQARVSRGIPVGGQFATTHSEPPLSLDASATEPEILANLNRPRVQVTLTEEQVANLRQAKTPITSTAARLGTGAVVIDLTATDNHIRDIQPHLQGR